MHTEPKTHAQRVLLAVVLTLTVIDGVVSSIPNPIVVAVNNRFVSSHLDSMFPISISESSIVQSTVDGDSETVPSVGYEEVSAVKLVKDFPSLWFLFLCTSPTRQFLWRPRPQVVPK